MALTIIFYVSSVSTENMSLRAPTKEYELALVGEGGSYKQGLSSSLPLHIPEDNVVESGG